MSESKSHDKILPENPSQFPSAILTVSITLTATIIHQITTITISITPSFP